MSIVNVWNYAFINAKIRARKSMLLRAGDYERLLQAKSFEDFMRMLGATQYSDMIARSTTSGFTLEDFGYMLSSEFSRESAKIAQYLHGKSQEFLKYYNYYFLFDAIKSVIRGIHVHVPPDEIRRYLIIPEPKDLKIIDNLLRAHSVEAVIELLPWSKLRSKLNAVLPQYQELNSTIPLEIAIERHYYETIQDLAYELLSKNDAKKAMQIISLKADSINTLTMIRGFNLNISKELIKSMLIGSPKNISMFAAIIDHANSIMDIFNLMDLTSLRPLANKIRAIYEETKSLSDIERPIDEHFVQNATKEFLGDPFNIGVVLGYIILKYYELKNIRIIGIGVEKGENPNIIRNQIIIW